MKNLLTIKYHFMQQKYNWDNEITQKVREQFEKTSGLRLKDSVYVLKQKWLDNKHLPRWIKSSVWEGLSAYWEDKANKTRSKLCSGNRNSPRGGYGPAKHTCGSMPYVRKRNKMVIFSLYFLYLITIVGIKI